MQTASSIQEIAAFVRENQHVRVRGGGSKPAAAQEANLSLAPLSGLLEYEPTEFTFTALAGTPLVELKAALGENGQYLPFDPPLAKRGATLGGTVACGLSGPGRYRYGGVRDFVLGVRFVNGEGGIVFGGGKVVKNAAGFDLPKLMVGGLGQCGVMAELTFKVFPLPEKYITLRADCRSLESVLETARKLANTQLEPSCLDFEPRGVLWLRVGGMADAIDARVARIGEFLSTPVEVFADQEDDRIWDGVREFRWCPPGHSLLKIPARPSLIPTLESGLADLEIDPPRRYSVGGHVLWTAWPDALPRRKLAWYLQQVDRRALALTGHWPSPLLGPRDEDAFGERLLSVLDPQAKFRMGKEEQVR